MTDHSRSVEQYLEARSLKELRVLKIKTQAKHGQKIIFRDNNHYTDKRGRLRFYCWYDTAFTSENLDEFLGE